MFEKISFFYKEVLEEASFIMKKARAIISYDQWNQLHQSTHRKIHALFLWRTIMHCIMPFSKRSLSPSGLRRVGEELVWEVGKKAQVEESVARGCWHLPPRAYIYTFYLSVRARCTANDNQLVAPPNARASARETCILYFVSNTHRWDFNEASVADPRSSLPFLLFFPRTHLRQVHSRRCCLECAAIALKITAKETRMQIAK